MSLSNQNSLAIFTQAAVLLAEANTVQKAKELKDLAITAGEWAKRKNAGEQAIQHCRTYAFEAERRMGELLATIDLSKGGRPSKDGKTGTRWEPVSSPPTIAELGITKKESSRAQKLAALPEDTFRAVRDGKKRFNEVRREMKLEEVKEAAAFPDAKYRVIYADPPWKYGDQLTEDYGPTKFHYPSMTISQLCSLPIEPLCSGWICKLAWIPDLRTLAFHSWPGWTEFKSELSTSRKGALAVDCVVAAMRIGRFPLWLDAAEDERENIQRQGTDILVFCRKRIQVKCDFRAGETGNLFLQKSERNPLRRR